MRIALAIVLWTAQVQLPFPLAHLQATLASAVSRAPGVAAVAVRDLGSSYMSGYNMNEVMPAASTIKIPIMVEVFRQMEAGRFDLNRHVQLMANDRDWGSGAIADAPVGEEFAVSTLLTQMITVSDNTAANMLIRLVGRQNINHTMQRLGLQHTLLADFIHTEGWDVRETLRTTPADMTRLLAEMAQKKLIDQWASAQMIDILEHQEINTLLPEPLPEIPIAHKTGSFSDTLNDVGIVYAAQPYVIAIFSTELPSLPVGRQFIHRVSRIAYTQFQQLAKLRASGSIAEPADLSATPQPQDAAGDDQDESMWATPPPTPSPSPGADNF